MTGLFKIAPIFILLATFGPDISSGFGLSALTGLVGGGGCSDDKGRGGSGGCSGGYSGGSKDSWSVETKGIV